MTNFHSFPGISHLWSGTSHDDSCLLEPCRQNSIIGVNSVDHSQQLHNWAESSAQGFSIQHFRSNLGVIYHVPLFPQHISPKTGYMCLTYTTGIRLHFERSVPSKRQGA